ncbi:NAD-dependent epimerase/dehydratase family protein [Actinomadura welshii]
MKVAVTGAAGMLGLNVVRRLMDDGHEVHSVDLRPWSAELGAANRRHTQGDVRDPEVMATVVAGADAVVHCAAALPSYPAEQIRSVIVGGTRNVLEAARRAGVRRAVHISSTAVYGLPTVVPTTEEYPREPVDPYSRAKAEAETVCEQFRDRGMCVPMLRPKTFLGPGRMGLFSILFEWAEEGRNFPVLGSGDVRIQMFALEDLVDVVTTTLQAPDDVANDTYNVGAAEFGTLREDFQSVLDAAGHGRRVVSLPARPTYMALSLLERTKLSPVYGRLLSKLRSDSYVSIEHARNRLQFQPRYSNQDAILRTFQWWRTERAAGRLATATGATSREPWRQGVLSLGKAFF